MVSSGKSLFHSIFPPLRGKYYKEKLSVLCVSSEQRERAVNLRIRKGASEMDNGLIERIENILKTLNELRGHL